MVISCCALNCTYRFKKANVEGQRSMHRFPLCNKVLLKKWVIATRRINWKPSKTSFICSAHFLPNDYLQRDNFKKRLKPDAVPSIFTFPEHLMKKPKFRRVLHRHVETDTDSRIPEPQVTSSPTLTPNIEVIHVFETLSATPTISSNDKACQTHKSISPSNVRARKTIAALRATNRRMRIKIQKMKDVIKVLKKDKK